MSVHSILGQLNFKPGQSDFKSGQSGSINQQVAPVSNRPSFIPDLFSFTQGQPSFMLTQLNQAAEVLN